MSGFPDPADTPGFDSDTGRSKYPRDKFKVGNRVRIVNLFEDEADGPDDRLQYDSMTGTIVSIEPVGSHMYPYQILVDNAEKENSLQYRYEQSELIKASPKKIDSNGNLE